MKSQVQTSTINDSYCSQKQVYPEANETYNAGCGICTGPFQIFGKPLAIF